MLKKQTSFEKNGSDWYSDRYESLRVERNRYFLLLLLCLSALIASVIANLLLSPLKTAVPYVIEVNKVDGATTVLRPADTRSVQENEAVTLYFLYKYLAARVSYHYGLRQINAETVRALSTAQTYQQYVQQIDTSNPQSPVRLYRDQATIAMKVIGYSFPYPNIAQIHFYTDLQNNAAGGKSPIRRYWQATIKFSYAAAPLPMSERVNINPLGFFVTDFQVNEQMLPKGEANS